MPRKRKAGNENQALPMNAAGKVDLVALRKQIDAIDEQIHALINERTSWAQKVGFSKSSEGGAASFYRPEIGRAHV